MPKTVRPYHHGDLREHLLNAGEQALGEMPVDKVTLREIARRAGVSHAAPQHHFPSLGHLLGEIAARGFQRFVATLGQAADAAAEQTPHARMLAMSRAYLEFAATHAAAYRLMFGQREPMVVTPSFTSASQAAWTQLVDGVSAIVGPEKSQSAALHVWSSVHGLSSLLQSGRVPPSAPRNAMIEAKLRMMMEGLKAA